MPSLKSQLRNNELVIGSWLSLRSMAVCEMMVEAGFDWLVIDQEHTPTNPEKMVDMIRVIELAGATPMVRVGANDPLLIKHALDGGAHGIVVPQVTTAEDARNAVEAAYYPPRGNRGVGLYRAQGYGNAFEEYKARAAEETVVVVQIEHRIGVENMEEILAVDGVDAFFVGPYDLSASFGNPGAFDAPEVKDAMAKVATFVENGPVPGGIHVVRPEQDELSRRVDEGYKFIAYGVDMIFLSHVLKGEGELLKTLKG